MAERPETLAHRDRLYHGLLCLSVGRSSPGSATPWRVSRWAEAALSSRSLSPLKPAGIAALALHDGQPTLEEGLDLLLLAGLRLEPYVQRVADDGVLLSARPSYFLAARVSGATTSAMVGGAAASL